MMILAIVATLSATPDPGARSRTKPESLVGVWAIDTSFGPKVRGMLAIDGRQTPWRARIAGYDVSIERDSDGLRFDLPNHAGQFRGHVRGTALDGFWVQPPGVANNTGYATPVRFAFLGSKRWRGAVTPLEDRVRFYVRIEPRPDGSLTAVIADPEFNAFRRRSYVVAVSDNHVELRNTGRPHDTITGTWDPAADQLSLSLVDSSVSPKGLVLTRRAGSGAVGFFPRRDGAVSYNYDRPTTRGDGWRVASLGEVGLDERPIAELVRQILSADPRDNPLDIHSLLIARHGKLAVEEYFYGFAADQPHDMRSASKTFASVLVGAARDNGADIGPATRVYPLFRTDGPFAHWDERKNQITVGNLMTMTSGLACDDNDDASPGNEDTMQSQSAQADWYRYVLDLPLVRDPGGHRAVYCSGGVNLVGGAVDHSTHRWLPELFDQYIARPLGFGEYHINLMPTGEAYLGGGLRLRPRDELKLGQLYLDHGRWNGRRVVSADWVAQSVATHSEFDAQTSYDAPHEYGFGWHINYVHAAGRVYRVYSAGGNGGQIVMVVPDLDLVVGFNGGSYGEFTKWYRWGLQLVPQYIIPAVLAR